MAQARVPASQQVRGFRTRHGLSQPQLGKLLGVDSRTISRWERGVQRTPQYVVDLALIELARRLRQERQS